ncbi:hypothetical protein [Pseudonocardia sp.]|uniref:GNAT family N-acetyltransferase n=1 Tax=Pseudonocardia sp. TaxID=60912 RepID=UPI0031FDB779
MVTATPATAETHLTDGWEPATPHADSLCRRFVHHWAEQNVAFAAAAGGTVVRTDRFVLADYGYPTGFFNGVVLLAPPRNWDDVLDELDPLLAGGTGDVMLWSLWPTPDLHRRGWSLMGHPPLLLRPPAELAPAPPPAPTPRVVGTAADLAVWEDVAARAYPLPELVGGQAGRLASPTLLADERLAFRISDDISDDAGVLRTPVSVSAHFVAHDLGSLAFGATLPTSRGRGHWAQHARARLRTRPDLWHSGIFSDDSRPLAEALGFVPIVRFTLWHRPRSTREHR